MFDVQSMTHKSGVNGNHGKHTSVFTIDEDNWGKSVPCQILGCNDWVIVKHNHHIRNIPVGCGNGHVLQVWFSPESKTYMVSSV